MNQRTFSIIGPGRAGMAIAKALANNGWVISRVAGRSIEHAQPLAEKLGAVACMAADVGLGVDLIIIATPDSAISETAQIVSVQAASGALLIHLAGATGVEALEGVRSTRPDLVLGSMHPLQTLSDDDAFEKLQGAFCAVEGPPKIEELARELGLTPFSVLPENRSAYHATAVVASNHLVALMGQVERMANNAGVPFEAFAPLARTAIEAALISGPASALTGPVSRGDTATIEAHLRAIDPSEVAVYKVLSLDALRLSGRDDAALEELLS